MIQPSAQELKERLASISNKKQFVNEHFEAVNVCATAETHARRGGGYRIVELGTEGALRRARCKHCPTNTPTIIEAGNPIGTNATTALNHLAKIHGELFDTEAKVQYFSFLCRMGIPYAAFDDERFLRGCVFKMNGNEVRRYVSELEDASLRRMGGDFQRAKGGCSIVCDLGTVDGVHTLSVLAVHIRLKRAYLVAVRRVEDTTAVGLKDAMKNVLKRFRQYTSYSRNGASPIANAYPVYGLVVDNDPNMLNAVKLLRDDAEACVPHALCFNCGCHVLNLIGHDVTREFLKERGHEEVLSEVARMGLARRVCPTRWWSAVDEYERVLESADAVAQIAQHPNFANVDAIGILKILVALQRDLRISARKLEHDSANVLHAVNEMVLLLNHDNLHVRRAATNHYLKYYATSEVPFLIALLSRGVLSAMGSLTINTFLAGEIESVLFPLIGRHLQSGYLVSLCWNALASRKRTSARSPFLHQFHESNDHFLAPLDTIAHQICSIAASEASAERSLSRQKIICAGAGRFPLKNEQSEAELIVAFNPVERENIPDDLESQSDKDDSLRCLPLEAVQYRPPGEQESHTSSAEKPHDNEQALGECHGVQVLMLHMYANYYLSSLRSAKPTDKKPPTVFWRTFENGMSWSKGSLDTFNAKTNIITVVCPRKMVYKFDLFSAFTRDLHLGDAPSYAWPNDDYRINEGPLTCTPCKPSLAAGEDDCDDDVVLDEDLKPGVKDF